ncbi:MAG: hypothetical protein LBU20_02855, partial [Candidatus Nomurabacteria bacterium]|nr:hypothetical protein [Candidatus Nomurabacteria bacterium]
SRVSEYLNNLIETELKPFFAEALPTIFDKNLEIEVKFHGSDRVRISADKVGPDIKYEAPIASGGDSDIAHQPATFRETLKNDHLSNTVFEREIVDSIILIHEMTHKYCDSFLTENNVSYQFLQEASAITKNPNTPAIIKGVDNRELLGDSKRLFTSAELKNYHGLTEDWGEALAKSIEKIFIEKRYFEGKLSREQYEGLLGVEQDLRDGDVMLATNNPESQTNRAYEDQVFVRLYQQTGEIGLVEFLRRVNLISENGLVRIDPKTGQYTERYKYLMDHPGELLKTRQLINEDSPLDSLADLLSSEVASRVGVDTSKYTRRSK